MSALKPSYYESEVGERFVELRCLHVKQNGTDCAGTIFVIPADVKQSCARLLEQRVSDSCRAVHTQLQSDMKRDPIRRYPVSYK